MKKKITAVALAVMLVALLVTGMSIAYFTDTENAVNVFTIGSIDIKLEEEGWPEEGIKNAVPGVSYEKKPVVSNIGSNPAYLLVEVTLEGYSGSIAPDTFFVNLNKTDFTVIENSNGKLVLAANNILAPNTGLTVFEAVKLPGALTQADLPGAGGHFKVNVSAKAIQAESLTREAAFSELGVTLPANP